MRKIKTKNHECCETNDMKMTKCLDDFYIRKLNCTFPWLNNVILGSLEKCGSKHYIYDLMELINIVAKGENISNEVEKCLVPNCATASWRMMNKEVSSFNSKVAVYAAVFDTTQKVNEWYITSQEETVESS